MKPAIVYASTLYLLSLVLALLFLRPISAATNSYVVYLGAHSHGTQATSNDYERVTQSHYEFLGSFLGSPDEAKDVMSHSYTRHINGFAATLEDAVASEIFKHSKVISVFLNRAKKLHTTRSWDFLGLENNGEIHDTSLWKKARFGEGVIIGNIDDGVWPESKSFSDERMVLGPIPSNWKGICQKGMDKNFSCNSKLIGARYFNKRIDLEKTSENPTFETPRDVSGHGTHTLSIAGGNFVPGVSAFGLGYGTAKGGSPRARVASYKVCWDECFDADVLDAFDMAIYDGVDVLSVSLGGDAVRFYEDSSAIGSFHAVMHGITVVCSAGNSGSDRETLENYAPWQIVVAESAIDREFHNYVILGNNARFKGTSYSENSTPGEQLFPIIYSRNAKAANANATSAELCYPGSLDPNKVKGKILICLMGEIARVVKGDEALLAGAVGMILANDEESWDRIVADPHVLPASNIDYKDAHVLMSYMSSTSSPMARITKPETELHTRPAPYMASASSVGPSKFTPEILKPDITAPGMSIIAAYTEEIGPTDQDFDKRRVKFNFMSGTSVSCPHVAGVVGLLKTLYPNWSPAAIKSAIMTTATTQDNALKPITVAWSGSKATPLNYGGGHLDPNSAMDPGLVYDSTPTDYMNFLCAMGFNSTQFHMFSKASYPCPKNSIRLVDFNYPAITVPNLRGSVVVTRRVKNVGPPGTYNAIVHSPFGTVVIVQPNILNFKSLGEEKYFSVNIQAKPGGKNDYVFGQLIWSGGGRNVSSPIVVKQI